MKIITSLTINLFIILVGFQNGNVGVVKASIQSSAVKASGTNQVDLKCSLQFAVPIEKFWGGLGARGSIRSNQGTEWNGWALFDTGATKTRLRHPTMKAGLDTEITMNSMLSFGDWRAAESSFLLSPQLWTTIAPNNTADVSGSEGMQIATIGTDIMKDYAVRIDDDKMYFTSLGQACTEAQLISSGYVRMDTSGFYQSEGQQVSVSARYTAPTTPTIWVKILGIKVPAQIDTGYQVQSGKNYIEVNKALMDLIKSKLPTPDSSGDNPATDYHISDDGLIYLTSKDAAADVASIRNIYIRPKRSGSGGIAEWDIPAAMISAPAFFKAFSSSEFRADNKSIWVKPR